MSDNRSAANQEQGTKNQEQGTKNSRMRLTSTLKLNIPMKTKIPHLILAGLLATAMVTHHADAALIAHYDFSDGDLFDDETGNGYTLTQPESFGTGITFNGDGFSAHFDADNSSASGGENQLFAGGFNGAAGTDYTVSMWFKTTVTEPTGNSSIFSSTGANDWQIEDTSNLKVLADATDLVSTVSSLASDTWYHVVMWTDGTDGKFYLTQEGSSLSLEATQTGTYSMDDFRIGVNRAQNITWEGDYASIAIYDTALTEDELNVLRVSGPIEIVPEPSSTALLGLGGLALMLRRKRS